MTEMIRAIIFKARRGQGRVIEVPMHGFLQACYEEIGCDSVEYVHMKGGLGIYVDEMGLMKENISVGALVVTSQDVHTPNGRLQGNLLFVGTNYDGHTVSLTDEQINFLRTLPLMDIREPDGHTHKAIVLQKGVSIYAY